MTLTLLLNNKSPDKKEEKEDRKTRKKKTKTEDQKRKKRKKIKKEETTPRRTREKNKKEEPALTDKAATPETVQTDGKIKTETETPEASSRNFPLFLLPLKTWIVHSADPCDRIPCGKYNETDIAPSHSPPSWN